MQNEFLKPGDVVTLNKHLPNAPTMIVVSKELCIFKTQKESSLRGIKCRWFTTTGELQEAVFNTKDLIKIDDEINK